MPPTLWTRAAQALVAQLRTRVQHLRENPERGDIVQTVIIIGGMALLAITVVAYITAKVTHRAFSINFG